MDFLGLSGRRIVVFGLANRKSVACAVGRVLVEAGADGKRAVMAPRRAGPDERRSPLGMARRALAEAIDYARRRQMFGQTLADFQLTQAKIGEMAALVDSAALLTYRAAWLRDTGQARGRPSLIHI